MALDDSKVLKPGTAHFYTAVTGTPLPEDLRNPGVEWTHMGHTSLEDILSATSEGGESTILGSLQKRQLRNSTSARTETFAVNLLQLDEDSLTLYFGSNVVVSGDGRVVSVPATPVAAERAWLCVMYDGDVDAGYYTAKAEFIRGEDISISDTESLTQLPIRITPLGADGADSPYDFIMPHAHVTPPAV
jgi:hypothetical protein